MKLKWRCAYSAEYNTNFLQKDVIVKNKHVVKILDHVKFEPNNRETGSQLFRTIIIPKLNKYEHIILDFIGCNDLSDSFLDEIFKGMCSHEPSTSITIISPDLKLWSSMVARKYRFNIHILKAGFGDGLLTSLSEGETWAKTEGLYFCTNIRQILKMSHDGLMTDDFCKLTSAIHKIKRKILKRDKERLGDAFERYADVSDRIRYKLIQYDELRLLYNKLAITTLDELQQFIVK